MRQLYHSSISRLELTSSEMYSFKGNPCYIDLEIGAEAQSRGSRRIFAVLNIQLPNNDVVLPSLLLFLKPRLFTAASTGAPLPNVASCERGSPRTNTARTGLRDRENIRAQAGWFVLKFENLKS